MGNGEICGGNGGVNTLNFHPMNRVDRLFAILLNLQHKRRVRAQDLAREFEISKRTIYRDISALNQMGVPIVSLPGEGFELVEGYYLPPLMFTEKEAVALVLGSRLLTQHTVGALSQSADSALAKIKVALPERVRAQAEALTSIIGFFAPQARFDLDDPQLRLVQKAIHGRRVLHIRYHSYRQDETTERDVEPYRLFYADGVWYFEAYCRLRQAVRAFRLSRVESLTLQKATFPERHTSQPETGQTLSICIRFAPEVVRWVRERQHYGFQTEEPAENGGITMIYHVQEVGEIQTWILGWGANAEVLSPSDLRKNLREIAQTLADMLT